MSLSEDECAFADLQVVRLRAGDARTEAEAADRLRAWTAGHPERTRHVERMLAVEGLLQAHASQLRPTPMPVPRRASPRPMPARWLGVPAAALAAAAVVWVVNPPLSQADYRTAVGEQRRQTLADGSALTLNTDTEVLFRQRLRSRELVLARGEALFQVVPAWGRPFQVHAGATEVRVVGTEFGVRRFDDGALVTVAHGLVEVRQQQARLHLGADQQLRTRDGQALEPPRSTDAAQALGWRDGRLVFDGVPLAAALAEFERYRGAPIRQTGSGLDRLMVTGTFATAQADAFLQLLPKVYPVRVVFERDGTARVSLL